MSETTFCLQIRFNAADKELVLAELYRNDISSFQEGVFGDETQDNCQAESLIQCYFSKQSELESLSNELRNTLGNLITLQNTEIEEQVWTERWKEFSSPINIDSSILVTASWHQVTPAAGQQLITIDPEMAFGSGSHPTTKMCLRLISSLFTDITKAPKTVLDVGCGSGILSIAADLLGADEIIGIDIENAAIETSAKNAGINKAWNCQFSQTPLHEINAKFDLVVANILSGTLLGLWADLQKCCTQNAIIVLSGLLENELESFCNKLGITADQVIVENEWAALKIRSN